MNCPEKAYKTYLAIKLHFSDDKYDIFEYRGRIKPSISENKKPAFINFCKHIKNINHIQYMVANAVEGDLYCGVFDCEHGIKNYTNWKKRIDSLTYQFKMDMNEIISCMERNKLNLHEILFYKDRHPWIYKLYNGKLISIETVVILNKIYNFVESYYNIDDYLLNKFSRLIKKYHPFLTVDLPIFTNILGENYDSRFCIAEEKS